MTPMQDMIALAAAVSTGVLLFTSTPAQTLPKAMEAATSRPSASVRALCEEEMAKLCAVIPRKVLACLQDDMEKLKLACRLTPNGAEMIPK